jgi:hypothetical protein
MDRVPCQGRRKSSPIYLLLLMLRKSLAFDALETVNNSISICSHLTCLMGQGPETEISFASLVKAGGIQLVGAFSSSVPCFGISDL